MKKSLLVTAFLLTAPLLIQAQSTWNATTGNWNTAGNWSPSGIPVSGNSTALIFGGSTSYTATNNIGAGFQLNSLSLTNTANRVTIAGSSLDFISNGGTTPTISHTTVGTEAATISANVTLTNDLGITANGSSSSDWLTFSGAVSGAGKLSITTGGGNYFVILSNSSNSYGGGTAVSGGLKTTASDVLGSGTATLGGNGKWVLATATQSHANNISLNGQFTIDATVATTLSGDISLGANLLTLRTSGGSPTATASGIISGTGNIVKNDAGGTWNLSGNNTNSGTTTVNQGKLAVTGTTSGQGNYSITTNTSAGILAGNGTIGLAANKNINVIGASASVSGSLAPTDSTGAGSTVGTMVVSWASANAGNKVTFGNFGMYDVDVSASGSSDRLVMGTSGITGAFDLSSTSDILSLRTLAGGFDGSTYAIATYFGALTGTFDNLYLDGVLQASATTFTANSRTYNVVYGVANGAGGFDIQVVPEPSTVALFAMTAIAMGAFAFRSRRRF